MIANALSEACTWLSAFFLALALRLDGRSREEIQQTVAYIRRLLEPPAGEIEETE